MVEHEDAYSTIKARYGIWSEQSKTAEIVILQLTYNTPIVLHSMSYSNCFVQSSMLRDFPSQNYIFSHQSF